MIKLIFLCKRRPDITRDEYAKRILEGHVPLALEHHPTLRGYVINIAEGGQEDGEGFDSLHALSFDSLEDYRERLFDSPEGEQVIRRDVQRFLAGADSYSTSERIHRDESAARLRHERSPGVKWMCALKRHTGLNHAEFVDHWLGVQVPMLLQQRPEITRCVTNVVEARLSEAGEDWDGLTELHFARPEDAKEDPFAPAETNRTTEANGDRFVARSQTWPVREYVQL